MTPGEYRTALSTLGLSQLAAGRWLGVSSKTAQNYASKGPSGPAAVTIDCEIRLRRAVELLSVAVTWSQSEHLDAEVDAFMILKRTYHSKQTQEYSH